MDYKTGNRFGDKGWNEEATEVPTRKGIKKIAKRHHEVAVKKNSRGLLSESIVPCAVTQESGQPQKELWEMTLSEFIEDYYKKDKNPRTIWKGKDFTEQTARIEARKLGEGWKVEESPYEKGRFIVVNERSKPPLSEYKKEYEGDLSIVYNQIIKKARLEGKTVPPEATAGA